MKINILLALIFLSFITYANIDYLHGIVGMTLRDGGIGCVCHNIDPTPGVNVWIEGPDSVIINQTTQIKLLMTGGPAVKGGFNVASNLGELNSIDTLVSLSFGELTHSSPNPFVNDTVVWNFSYTAPDSLTTDTLYSVGNSVNGNGNPSQDQWNFGQNFVIHIIDNPVNVKTENLYPEDFVLYQNYPNPFNPSTKIGLRISDFGFVSLKVMIFSVMKLLYFRVAAASPAEVPMAMAETARQMLPKVRAAVSESQPKDRRASAPALGKSGAVVQLGAYRSPSRVLVAWNAEAKRFEGLRGYAPVSARFEGPNGTVYRLSVKGFADRAEATALCTGLRRSGGSCFVRNAAGDRPIQYASR